MLKVAFRVDISNEIGTGHYMRMSVLSEAFTELGCRCVFFKSADEPVDYSGFDIVVLDTYQISDAYISSLRTPGRILVCYDDNALYTYDCDILLNANFHANELSFRFAGESPVLLLGAKYALLRQEFRKVQPITIREKAKRIFICFGGSDLQNFTPFAVRALQEIPGVCLTVVLGAYTACDTEDALMNANVEVIKSPPSLCDVMVRCDIAVTAAGSMVYELASLGLPAIVITQADNQNLIAKYLQRNKMMRWVGSWSDANPELLRQETISLLNDPIRRKTEAQLLTQKVNRNGAVEAAKVILKMKGDLWRIF